jgi:hypothetical protein
VAAWLAAWAGGAAGAAAQPADPSDRFWVSGGVGFGALEEEVGAGFTFDGVLQRGSRLFALHATAVLAGYELSHVAGELGLLYGRASTGTGSFQWSAAAGASFVQVDMSGRRLRNTVGLPVAVHGSLDSRVIGIGAGAFANVNAAEPFGGLVVTLRVGRLS